MSSIDYDRINFEDLPSNLTPLAARILNRMDKAIDDIATQVNKTNTFILQSTNWTATGNAQYPYQQFISTDKYDDSDIPIAQAWGMNDIETSTEITNISYIKKVIVNSSGVTAYATNQPTVNLKLVLKA